MSDGFSEDVDYDWVTIQVTPAPPGTVSRVFDVDDNEIEIPVPVFLLQEARGVITVVATENGVGDREVEPLEPPFMTRVVPGALHQCGCGQSELDAVWGETSINGVGLGLSQR